MLSAKATEALLRGLDGSLRKELAASLLQMMFGVRWCIYPVQLVTNLEHQALALGGVEVGLL